MIVAFLMIHFFCSCKMRLWQIFIIFTCLYLAGLYIDTEGNAFSHEYWQLFSGTQNGFFQGGFYMTLGMILSRSKGRAMGICLTCMLLSVISLHVNIPIFYPLFSFGFVGFLLNIRSPKFMPPPNIQLVSQSMHVYIFVSFPTHSFPATNPALARRFSSRLCCCDSDLPCCSMVNNSFK